MSFGVRTRFRNLVRNTVGTNRLVVQALSLPTGQVSLAEARFLVQLAASLTAPGPVVEIGTLFGFSTRMLVIGKAPDRELVTVDNYAWNPLMLPPGLHRRCTAAVLAEAVADHHVRIVVADKSDFFDAYTGPSPALVFLDAVHTYDETLKDIEWARRAGASTICLHDYSPKHPGVVQAVDESGGPAKLIDSIAVLRA